MKVLLINPGTEWIISTELPAHVSKGVGRFPPLGILHLAAYIRENSGHDVVVLDMDGEGISLAELGERIKREAPGLVGISGTTHNLVGITRTVETVKNAAPGIRVCLGGPHVSAFPRESQEIEGVDYTIRGDGEESLLLLIDSIEDGADVRGIPGLTHALKGKVELAEEHACVRDLDTLPFPARDLVDQSLYTYVLGVKSTFTTIISSRGCPYKCSFCSTPHGNYRARSVKNVVREMELCAASGIGEIHFVDDTFNLLNDRSANLSREILDRGLDLKWSFRGRADSITDEEMELAAKAGCVRLHLGVETGSDSGLALLNKGTTTAQVERAIRLAGKYGIATAAYFLIGCPHEKSENDVQSTIDFAIRLNPDYAMFNILAVYPGTELHDTAVEKGLLEKDYWNGFVMEPTPGFQIPFWEEFLTRDELYLLLKKAYRRFYLRPGVIWKNLRNLQGLSELGRKAAAGISMFVGKE